MPTIIEPEDIEDRWYPIEESPKWGDIFIVWIEPPGRTEIDSLGIEYTIQFSFAVFMTVSRQWIVEGDYPEHCRITHWRPAPSRPEGRD